MDSGRLDKVICNMALLTRSGARDVIRSGRVTVDGAVEKDCGRRLRGDEKICLDGRVLSGGGARYIMLNKPAGVVSSTDDRDRTVLSLLPEDMARGLFPVGRLDKDVTGLVILTDDGDFCHRVTSPRHHVTKIYEAVASRPLDESDAAAFAEGLTLKDGTVCRPAVLNIDNRDRRHCTVEISEGMYHQVKRMFACRGKPLESLRRIAVGGLVLDELLPEGAWRSLSPKEVEAVFTQITTKE